MFQENYHFANMHWQKSGETDGMTGVRASGQEGRKALWVRNNVNLVQAIVLRQQASSST